MGLGELVVALEYELLDTTGDGVRDPDLVSRDYDDI